MKLSFAPLDHAGKVFLTERTGVEYRHIDMTHNWFCAQAWDEAGAIMGVLACERRMPTEFHFNVAIANPRCLSPRLMKAVFLTMFKAGAFRITALVDPNNQAAIKQAIRMGFVYEGFLRRGVEGRDALMFGMLPEDCRYFQTAQIRKNRELKESSYGFTAESS